VATQLLIYETAVPVNSARHGNWSVDTGGKYEFGRHLNSVPLMAVEFPQAAAEYAIVFAGAGDAVMPVAVLGIRAGENLYLDSDGSWQAQYVPAFLRRYPFVFASRDEGKTFTLCLDESYAGCNQDNRGQRLFTEEGKPSPFIEEVLKFLQEYQRQFQVTEAFCRRLKDLDLLETMQAQVSLNSGEKLALSGFMVVNRDRLKNLPAEKLAELAKSDELELIYLHLQSMRNFSATVNRLAAASAGK
jgi:hypothetical protein